MRLNHIRFVTVKPNYRKQAIEARVKVGKGTKSYLLPFSAFHDLDINSVNRFDKLTILSELARQVVRFKLVDGSKGEFPIDFVLYYCEPRYDWSPINQIKQALKDKLVASRLSLRVVADALKTSPAQVMRLLKINTVSLQLVQLCKLATLAGYRLDISLKKVA